MPRTYLINASFLSLAAACALLAGCSSQAQPGEGGDDAISDNDNWSITNPPVDEDPVSENEDSNANEGGGAPDPGNENDNSDNDIANENGSEPEPEPTFMPFLDESGAQLYFDYFQMIGGGLGYAANFPLVASEADIFETRDNSASWSSVNSVQTGNTALSASWWMHIHPEVMAVATRFSGFGVSGTLSVSFDGGQSWTRYEEPARNSCEITYSEGIRSFVVYDDTWRLTLGESANHTAARQGPAAAASGDWSCSDMNVSGAFLASTEDADGGAGHLFMWAYDSSSTEDWNLYWWDGGYWIGLRPHLPADFWLTAWATAKGDGTLTLIDAEGFDTPTYAALTIDAGRISDGLPAIETFYAHGADGDAEGYYLTRAIQQGDRAYVCDKSLTSGSVSDLRLRRFDPGTQTWETVVREQDSWSYYYYFQTDYAGRIYAIRWGSYITGFYDLGPSANY